MARDFTDYIVEIHGAGDRVYYQRHIRQLKKDPEITEFEFHGRTYLLNKDRAYRVKGYMPWRKWDLKRPIWTLKELTRSKKVGLIKYREPSYTEPQTVEIEREVPIRFQCTICRDKDKRAWVTKHQGGARSHVTKMHPGAKFDMVMEVQTELRKDLQTVMDTVEPMHMSKMHQPSGQFSQTGEPIILPEDSLLNIITPKILKIEVEDPSYVKQYKSYKFGKPMAMAQKWYLWLALGIVGVILILMVFR